MTDHSAITFRPASLSYLPLMAKWLMMPHMRDSYQPDPISPGEVAEEYGPLFSGETPDICHIAYYGELPFGYLQSYRNADYEDELPALDHGISVDLFIGEPDYIGRGLGSLMLREYLAQVAFPHFSDERFAYITHEAGDLDAIRASEAAGFRPVDEFEEDGDSVILFRFERGSNDNKKGGA
ncbi:GNAT family N-acetyltransferase [Phyllobacterium sp. 22229]|uniref:GNAT family N-acetyltransferase n=1 Tax=Phyllobacterium TaxID=28100 RepID=UPI0010297D9F|nr:GNAT family N-acetyltransferase [Phyllobacterium myrsinacearum]RZS82038.1 aminoglycoside 6'-N-acetyltransferase [Phyllobacterium myrsinacearum]